jgi:hypothetical protein
VSFRRARGLLTADRLESWLAAWEVSPDDFRRWTEDAATGTTTSTPWCALLCSGEFDTITADLVAAAAAACELGAPPILAADFDPTGWVERLVAAGMTTESLIAVIERHRLDWTRLETTTVQTSRRGVAEELRHQVLVDGLELEDAALKAGCEVRATADVLAAISADLRAAMAGVRAGELVGPLPTTAGWSMVSVRNRIEPTLDDPASRARAEAVVRSDVIARAVARHVVA